MGPLWSSTILTIKTMQGMWAVARVLILSSLVSFGHVGASVGQPLLQALGHSVTVLPTVILSNHPGWPHVSGAPTPVSQLEAMVTALDKNGWLGEHDAVQTGYLPTEQHVDFAARLIAQMQKFNPTLRIVVDPVVGDAPKGLYVAETVAAAQRDRLLSLADIVTPNACELGWLSDAPGQTLEQACQLAVGLAGTKRQVCLTSPPLGTGFTGLLKMNRQDMTLWSVPRWDGVPHGTGDALAALLAAGYPAGQALGFLQELIRHSLGCEHLRIAEAAALWTKAAAIAPKEDSDGL